MPIIGRISVGDGATFTPDVSNEGVLSWTNNKNLENPASVDIPQAVINRFQLAPIDSPAFTGTPTAPTPTAGDNSTKIATTEFVNGYLPLSGGTMTGNINMGSKAFNMGASSSDDGRIYTISNYLRIVGGNSTSNGSWLDVGSSSSSNKGITINASDGNGTTKELKALYDGTLTWDSNNILTAGNYSNYALPLSGGTVTGQIKSSYNDILARSTDTNYLTIMGGSTYSTGASLSLNGGSKSIDAGRFQLRARTDASTYVDLFGNANGLLKWNGERVSVQPKLLWRDKNGATTGDTINIPEAVNYSTFLMTASSDMTDSYGSSLTFMVSRFFDADTGLYKTSGSVRGGAPICFGNAFRIIGFNGNINESGVLTVSSCSMVVVAAGGNSVYENRKIYAVFGLHRV